MSIFDDSAFGGPTGAAWDFEDRPGWYQFQKRMDLELEGKFDRRYFIHMADEPIHPDEKGRSGARPDHVVYPRGAEKPLGRQTEVVAEAKWCERLAKADVDQLASYHAECDKGETKALLYIPYDTEVSEEVDAYAKASKVRIERRPRTGRWAE